MLYSYWGRFVWVGVTIATCSFAATNANAAAITLNDGNSSADIDLDNPAGQFGWTVDGTTQLFQQWFWYRVGDTGPESTIDTLGLDLHKLVDHGDPGDEKVLARYGYTNGATDLAVDLTFTLTGGTAGSGSSDILETIEVFNKSDSAPLSVDFFEYVDLDLGGTPADLSVEISGGNTAIQTDFNLLVSETSDVPLPDRWEVGVYPDTLTKLNDGDADDLDMNAGPILAQNLTWAFQWELVIPAAGDSNDPDTWQSIIISKDKVINFDTTPGGDPVPVPAAGFAGMALLAITAARRRNG